MNNKFINNKYDRDYFNILITVLAEQSVRMIKKDINQQKYQ